jgi:hypothetical protein
MEQPKLEFAFELNIQVSLQPEVGTTGKGTRKIISITGGSFEGPQIKGSILPGGYDWQLVRNDGVIEIDARYVLQTDDGNMITIVNTGLRHAPQEILQRLGKGEEVDPSLYYFRSIPVLETSAPKYDWLTKHIFIANGIRKPASVIIQVWKVL